MHEAATIFDYVTSDPSNSLTQHKAVSNVEYQANNTPTNKADGITYKDKLPKSLAFAAKETTTNFEDSGEVDPIKGHTPTC